MKMSRQDLKNIVKECLVEILSEGLADTTRTISESRMMSQPRQAQQQQQVAPVNRRQNIADKISFLPPKSEIRQSAPPQQQNHQALARSLTSDPVLADIFADTAKGGAHRQMNESSSTANHEQMIASAGDAAAKAMLRSDPVDVFGESASKWASLAFAEKIPARS